MNHDAPPARNGLGRPPSGDLRLTEPDAHQVDALADLFLADAPLGPKRSPAPPPTAQPKQRVATLERVVLGNLPVMPSAWIAQYARHTVQRIGEPVAVLRLDAAHASLDLVTPDGCEAIDPTASSRATLGDAINTAAAHATRWIVRAGDDFAGDTVTLLTSSDEPATVAAYRTLKELDEAHAEDVALRAVVLGPSLDEARIACDRISAAADAFLQTPIETEPCLAKLDAMATSTLFDNRSTHDATDVIAEIREATRAPRRPAQPPAAAEPVIGVAPAADPTAPSTSFDARIALGFVPVDIACPIAPDVQLGMDTGGTLQLVACAVSGSAPEAAVSALLAASFWATQHAPLLAKAEPRLTASHAIAHLVTDTPKGVLALGGSDIRVHAAARVGDAWGTVALF